VVPYVALGAELATGYEDRSSVVAWRTVIGTGAIVGTTIVAYSVFFAGADGLKRPEGYPGYGWTMGGLVLAAGLACCLTIWRQAAALPRAIPVPGALHRRLPGEVSEVLKNRSFRILFFSSVIFYVAQALHGALNTHVYLYVWLLPSEMIQFTSFAYLAGIIGGVPFVAVLARRWEKRTIVIIGLGMVCLSQTVMASLRAAGLFTLSGAEVLPWLCLNVAFAGLGVAFAAVAYPAMMADAADEHEHLFGFRREGLYFAGLGFSSKAAAGVGVLLAGVMLDVIRWPAELARQTGATVPEDVLVRLTLGWGPLVAVVSLVSLVVLLGYSISRRRHAEIAVALGRRPAAA
jgi:GPH family glycoside/pentoside/hexuronide:cation symporter